MKITEPGVYDISAEIYHEDPTPGPSLSGSVLNILLDMSPAHAKAAHPRLTKNPAKHEDTKETDIGTAAHALLLEGEEVFQIVHANDWRTKAAQKAAAEARDAGFIPLLPRQADDVFGMVEAARAQLFVHEASDIFTNGEPERVLIWREADLWCRARVDWLSDCVDDYKTTGLAAHPETWSKRLYSAGYHVKAAFYARGYQALFGKPPRACRFVVQEIKKPYLLSVLTPDPMGWDYARRKVEHGIAKWRECMQSGEWPGYPNRVCYAQMPSWAAYQWDEQEIREEAA